MIGLKKKKDVGKIRNIPEDIIKRILDSIDINTYIELRDYALIVLTLDAGIRSSEACGGKINDLDLEHAELIVRVEVAKTRVKRVLSLFYQTVEILKNFIAIRDIKWPSFIFLTIVCEVILH